MSAVKRRVFNVLAAVSLALCVALVALAVRSCWVFDSVEVAIGSSQVGVESMAGELGFSVPDHGSGSSFVYSRFRPPSDGGGLIFQWKMVHFAVHTRDWKPVSGFKVAIVFPNWVLAVPLGCLAWWFRRKSRRQTQVGFAVEQVER
jgi:hypothetical protein